MERAALPAAGFDALDELDEVALAVPRDFAPSAEFVLAPAWAGLAIAAVAEELRATVLEFAALAALAPLVPVLPALLALFCICAASV